MKNKSKKIMVILVIVIGLIIASIVIPIIVKGGSNSAQNLQVLSGKAFTSDIAGVAVQGAMTNYGDAVFRNPVDAEGEDYIANVDLDDGYYKSVQINAKPIYDKGVAAGTASLTGGNASSSQILKDKTAYVNGQLVTGTMKNKSGQIVTSTGIQSSSTNVSITIPENAYYDNTSRVSVSTADLLENIFNGNMTRVTPAAAVKSWTADKDYPILFVTGWNTNFTSTSSSTYPYPSINGSQLSILVGNTWDNKICTWVFLVTDVKAGDVFTVPSDCNMDIKTLSRLIS